jgi:hypothetical protein
MQDGAHVQASALSKSAGNTQSMLSVTHTGKLAGENDHDYGLIKWGFQSPTPARCAVQARSS